MITSDDYAGEKVFFCTDESEWKDLVSKGRVVFRVEETNLIREFPDLFATEFWEAVFRMKKAVPAVRILRVRKRA